MIKVESAANENYKRLLSLTTSKGLKKEGLFILSGEKLIQEFLKSQSQMAKSTSGLKVMYEITTDKLEPLTDSKVMILSPALFREMDVLGTHFNLLVLELPEIEKVMLAPEPQGFELLLPVGDPANLGAMLRSCEAFGVKEVILTQEAAHPYLPKSVKASAGSVLKLKIKRGPALAELPHNCIALDDDGTDIQKFAWPKNCRLVLGEEGPGLKNLRFQKTLSVPTQGVESLNAVVAGSIALYLRSTHVSL